MNWQPQPGQFQARPPQQNNDMATVALCLSLGSLAVLVVGVPLTLGFSMLLSGPLAVAGLVCGLLGRQKADRGEAAGRSMAQAAFIVGIVSLVLHLITVVVGIVLIALAVEWLQDFEVPEPDQPPDADPA